MDKIKTFIDSFTKFEKVLWAFSVIFITVSFFIFDGSDYLTLTSSLIGVTSLILNAKGNPIGQVLMIIFSILYGIISYSFSYFGEMMTYLGMTGPMAVLALISWLRNPYEGKRSEVKVNKLKSSEIFFMFILSGAVTALFYFILLYFNTANMIPSTISVTTSFLAVYLTFRRSAFFPLAYAANDVVLIILWTLATKENIGYLSVVICFVVFFVNDFYGFVSWSKMKRRQNEREGD